MEQSDRALKETYNFKYALKAYPQTGNLVYEYNPFRNLRLDEDMIYYKQSMLTFAEFIKDVKYNGKQDATEADINELKAGITDWYSYGVPKYETLPQVHQAGELVDFDTDQLQFSLKNPVSIVPQQSYDNSVNLIINDGLNQPRLINSRFSVTERNKYQICDRKGNNDTNIYDQGIQFDTDTSLYKKTTTIVGLKFLGVTFGGNLSVGNYHFYFRYKDSDGNESDFIAESGLVSIFIGNTPDSINSGFMNENAHKQVKFLISNIDTSYDSIQVFYTRATSDVNQDAVVNAYKIEQDFKINSSTQSLIAITGYENVMEVTITEVNPLYQIYGSAETQDQCQNMLFLANTDKPKIDYNDFADCALRFIPQLDTSERYEASGIHNYYTGSASNTYFDPSYIYKKTGYWNDEIYRFGIVFIKSDNTLTEVFNVRGGRLEENTESAKEFSNIPFLKDGRRNYITYSEQDFSIISDKSDIGLENAKGVVHISYNGFYTVTGINFIVAKEVLEYIKNTLNVKGFFFVRQKRIPTTLCQAYTIAVDRQSHTPVLPIGDGKYITESFLTQDDTNVDARLLGYDLAQRKITLESNQVQQVAAICPEYDVNYPFLNTIFSGTECTYRGSNQKFLTEDSIYPLFYVKDYEPFTQNDHYNDMKILGMEDDKKLGAIGDTFYSARAGEAEEAFRFEYAGTKLKSADNARLLRGSYGPFLGLSDNMLTAGQLIDIKIPGYSQGNMSDYFKIRYSDKAPFYAISDRMDIDDMTQFTVNPNGTSTLMLTQPLYRGDCYICQFTHRLNRNFQDPSTPINDDIVDEKCWKDHFKFNDGVLDVEEFDNINRGDVNAVKEGMYVQLIVRSTFNLNIRSIDKSNADEYGLTSHHRAFYPLYPMTNDGSYKIKDALAINQGLQKSVSERTYFEVPDVPWIKNEFSNRIAYSNIQIKDAFQNGWRIFRGMCYRDYPKTYGSITRILEWQGKLLCVFEHGVAIIPVNERAVAAEGSGGYAYINTSNVLPENPNVLSDMYGSQWRESIVKTPYGVFGVDTVAKKIWMYNGEQFSCISDVHVQEFLNRNITLTERETDPIIGIRNVKTHYNKFKQDVMFTFYDNLYGFTERVWNLCYNIVQSRFVTFYSWVPSYSENIYNQYFSFDRNTSKWIAKLGVSNATSQFKDGVCLSNNIIRKSNSVVGTLSLENRELPKNVKYAITYTLQRDNYQNYKKFSITGNTLTFNGNLEDIKSELYKRDEDGKILKDDTGKRLWLDRDSQKNPDKIVLLLNLRASVTI